jgi:hypothetical protein
MRRKSHLGNHRISFLLFYFIYFVWEYFEQKQEKYKALIGPQKKQKRQKKKKEKEKVARFLSVDRSCAHYPAMKALERTDGCIRSFVRSLVRTCVDDR